MKVVWPGYVPLADVINVVGKRSYGADWIGSSATALRSMTGEIRYQGPRSAEEKSVVREMEIAEQQQAVIYRYLQTKFVGSPPNYDAVPTLIVPDDGNDPVLIGARQWMDDQRAWGWLRYGRATIGNISGDIVIPEAAIGTSQQEVEAVGPETSAAEPETPTGTRTTRAERAEQACGKWIAGLQERPANRETALTLARAAVKGIGPLSERAFERAWASNAWPGWKLGGRRRKDS